MRDLKIEQEIRRDLAKLILDYNQDETETLLVDVLKLMVNRFQQRRGNKAACDLSLRFVDILFLEMKSLEVGDSFLDELRRRLY